MCNLATRGGTGGKEGLRDRVPVQGWPGAQQVDDKLALKAREASTCVGFFRDGQSGGDDHAGPLEGGFGGLAGPRGGGECPRIDCPTPVRGRRFLHDLVIFEARCYSRQGLPSSKKQLWGSERGGQEQPETLKKRGRQGRGVRAERAARSVCCTHKVVYRTGFLQSLPA